jgi:O-Antigen ligase
MGRSDNPMIISILQMGGLGAFIFSFQFLHAFSPSVYVPISFIIAVMMFFFHLSMGIPARSHFRKSDYFLLGTFIFGIFPLITFREYAGIQNVLYSAVWMGVPLLYFFWGRIWLFASGVTMDQVGKAALVTVIFLSFAIVVEFILANATGHYLSDYLPFSISVFPEANVLGDDYLRPRGFSSEAGFTAVVFEALLPLAVYYVYNQKVTYYLFGLLVVPAVFLLFSAALWLSLLIAFLFYIVFYSRKKILGLSCFAGFFVIVIILYLSVSQFQFFLDQIIVRKLLEFSSSTEVVVTEWTAGRPEAYSLGLQLLTDFPFGIGWGMLSQMFTSNNLLPGVDVVKNTGLISIPLEVFVSSGVLGGCFFLCFLGMKLRQTFRSHSEIAPYLFIALTTVSLHHAIILEFTFPMFWFLLALCDYDHDVQNQ